MASYQYTRGATQEELSAPKQRVYTKKELWDNWWDYNLKWVLAGIASVLVIGYIVVDTYFFQPEVDYSIAIVSAKNILEPERDALCDVISPLLPDRTGDGVATIQLNSYYVNFHHEGDDASVAAETVMAGQVQLASDISASMSNIFLLQDPEGFQHASQLLCDLEGNYAPDGTDGDWTQMVYPLESCDAFGTLTESFEGFYIARRGGFAEEAIACFEQNAPVWDILTEGATPLTEGES